MSVENLRPEEIYGKEASAHREAFRSLVPYFTETFGHRPERFYRAPGRVEIGGNHTDHQGGVTLSAAVGRVSAVPAGSVRYRSEGE